MRRNDENRLRAELSDLFMLAEILDILEEHSIHEINRSELVGLLADEIFTRIGDRSYGGFLTSEQYQARLDARTGTHVGIGVTVQHHPHSIEILDVSTNSPAANSGLRVGDLITSIENRTVEGMANSERVALIRGEEGTYVNLTLDRGGETINARVRRARLQLAPPIVYSLAPDGITGIIRIRTFGDDRVRTQFNDALEYLTNSGAEQFIFDVRGNGGGSVGNVVAILRQLLPAGRIITLNYGNGTSQTHYVESDSGFDAPIVVLTDENSASASELFVAALRDNNIGTFIGTTTFGKGSVQRYFRLSNGSAIRTTVGMFYPPSGINFDGVGIIPDIEVQREGNINFNEINFEYDNQLIIALEYFR